MLEPYSQSWWGQLALWRNYVICTLHNCPNAHPMLLTKTLNRPQFNHTAPGATAQTHIQRDESTPLWLIAHGASLPCPHRRATDASGSCGSSSHGVRARLPQLEPALRATYHLLLARHGCHTRQARRQVATHRQQQWQWGGRRGTDGDTGVGKLACCKCIDCATCPSHAQSWPRQML